jgi:GMP synthase (glutamine-hydrolysing)
MKLHSLHHVPFEGVGSIADWAQARGHQLSASQLYADASLPSIDSFDGLIVMGGPMGVDDEREHPWLVEEKRFIERAIAAGKTVLGVCLGAQLVACVLGARVYRNADKEIGWFPVQLSDAATNSTCFSTLPSRLEVFHWHGDTFDLPAGAVHIARSHACQNQAFVFDKRIVGLQFHLETTRHTAAELIRHCRHEIVPARFIQTAQEMLADERRFEKINAAMEQVLTGLEQD